MVFSGKTVINPRDMLDAAIGACYNRIMKKSHKDLFFEFLAVVCFLLWLLLPWQ